jgi:hypothetical protein
VLSGSSFSRGPLVPIPTFFFNLENLCFQSNELKFFNRTLGPVLDLVLHMSRLLVPKFSEKLLSESNSKRDPASPKY